MKHADLPGLCELAPQGGRGDGEARLRPMREGFVLPLPSRRAFLYLSHPSAGGDRICSPIVAAAVVHDHQTGQVDIRPVLVFDPT